MSQTIDILIKIKQAGEEIIKSVNKQLQTMKDTIVSMPKMDVAIAAPVAAATAQMADSGKGIAAGIQRQLPTISNLILTKAHDLIDNLKSMSQSFANQLQKLAERNTNQLNTAIGSKSEALWSRAVVAEAALIGGAYLSIAKEAGMIGSIFKSWISNIGGVGKAIQECLVDKFTVAKDLVYGIGANIKNIGAGTGGFLGSLLEVGKAMGSIYSLVLGIFFTRYFWNEAVTFFKRIIGFGNQVLSPIERLSRLITTIDSTLISTKFTVASLVPTALVGIAAFAGPFAGIVTGLAFANKLLTNLLQFMEKPILQFRAFFGDSRARFQLIFLRLREALYDASRVLETLIPKVTKFLDYTINGVQNLQTTTQKINAGGFTKEMAGLQGIRFPLGAQLQLLIAEVRPFMSAMVQQIRQAVLSLQVGLGLSQEQIGKVQQQSDRFLGTVKNKASDALGFVNHQLKRTFDWSGIHRGLSDAWGKIKSVSMGALSGWEKIIGGSVSLVSGLFTKVFGLFSKGQPPAAKPVDNAAVNQAAAASAGKLDLANKVLIGDFTTLVSVLFNYDKLLAAVAKEQGNLAKILDSTSRQYLKSFLNALNTSIEKGFEPGHFQKILSTFFAKVVVPLSAKLNIALDMDALTKQLSAVKLSPDMLKAGVASIKSALESFMLAVGDTKILEKRMDVGSLFTKALTSGVKNKFPQLESVFQSFSETMKGFFAGSGESFIKELGTGIEKNASRIKPVLAGIGARIKRFFPHSPAEEGPLTDLRHWGAKIIDELTFGISSKITSFFGIFNKLAGQVQTALAPILEIGMSSERSGVDAGVFGSLKYAFADIKVSTGDLTNVFYSLNKVLSTTASPETLYAFSQIGVDLEKARNSGQPALELFLQIADSIHNSPRNMEELQKALDTAGFSINSNLYNALKKGRQGVLDLMDEGKNVGANFSNEFVKLSTRFNATFTKISEIGQYLEYDFIQAILPTIDSMSQRLWRFYEENAADIRGLITILGEMFSIALQFVENFIAEAIKRPDQALQTLANLFLFTWRTVLNLANTIIDDFLEGLVGKVSNIIGAASSLIWKAPWRYIKAFGAEVLKWFGSLSNDVYELVLKAMKKLPDKLIRFLGLEDAIKDLEKDVAETAKRTSTDFAAAFSKAVGEVEQDIAGVRESIRTNLSDAVDPETIKKTAARFKEFWETTGAELKATLADTGFDKVFMDAYDRIDKAFSKNNWREVTDQLEIVKDKAEEAIGSIKDASLAIKDAAIAGLDGIKAGMPQVETYDQVSGKFVSLWGVLDTAKEKAKSFLEVIADATVAAAKAALDGLGIVTSSLSKIGEKEMRALTDKQNELLADMKLRSLPADSMDALYANQGKGSKELEKKQRDEAKTYAETLAAKYQISLAAAQQTNEMQEFYHLQQLERDKQEADHRQEVVTRVTGFFGSLAQTTSNMLGDLYEMSGKKVKEFFYAQRAAAIIEAGMNVAQGITKALAQGGVWGIAQGALVAAAGTIQVAKIIGSTIQGFISGGLVTKGSGTKDDVPALLNRREFVQPSDAVGLYGVDFMEAVRRKLIPADAVDRLMAGLTNPMAQPRAVVALAAGGMAASGIAGSTSRPSAPAAQAQQQPGAVVNVIDPAMVGRFLASSAGKNALLNIISDDPRFRRALARG